MNLNPAIAVVEFVVSATNRNDRPIHLDHERLRHVVCHVVADVRFDVGVDVDVDIDVDIDAADADAIDCLAVAVAVAVDDVDVGPATHDAHTDWGVML